MNMIELNKIFTVQKGNVARRWKVIEHPYFEGKLALVHDYMCMTSNYKQADNEHICGSTTLENAYEDAYLYT